MTLSVYLLSTISAWSVAQATKYIYSSLKARRWFGGSSLFHSGNMPSVHTATTVALTVTIGVENGVNSGIFALALLFTSVVAYDAMGVRRATGEQGLALRQLLKKSSVLPYHSLGHHPIEVAAGALIGAVVSLAVLFLSVNFL